MSIFEAIILGIVEGVTEFLPISSTAHLLLVSEILAIPPSAYLSSFIIAIQLGAICAVLLLYWRTILLDIETMKRVAVAFLPTALIGFLLYKLITLFLFENLFIVAGALVSGGIVLILFEKFHTPRPHTPEPMSYRTAFLIGCAQALAVVPGVSRAGATIIGGLSLGVSRERIVEFSFLLAIPTMLAATGYDLLKNGFAFSGEEWQSLAIGFIVAALAAFVGVRLLVRYIQTHSFAAFGWYRIVLGSLICIVLLI